MHVRDVTRACRLALETGNGAGQAINVGSGRSTSIAEVAQKRSRRSVCGRRSGRISPAISGPVIFVIASPTSGARAKCWDLEANVSFDEGLRELVEWLSEEPAVDLTSVA